MATTTKDITKKAKTVRKEATFNDYIKPLLETKETGVIDTSAIKPDRVYVAQNYIYEGKSTPYKFTRKGIRYNKRVINKVFSTNHNLFERLRENQPRKLYFDIDIDSKRGHTNYGKYSIEDIVKACDTAVKVVCDEYKIEVDVTKHQVCYVEDQTVKQSLHITYPLYFKNYYDCKEMYACIQDKLFTSVCTDLEVARNILVEGESKGDQKMCYIDSKVYARLQNMRCLYQSKADKPKAVLIPFGNSSSDPIDHLIGCYEDYKTYSYVSMTAIIQDMEKKTGKKHKTIKPAKKQGAELRAYTPDEIKYDMTLSDHIERLMSCIPNSNTKPQSWKLWNMLGISLWSVSKMNNVDYLPLWIKWSNQANTHYPNEGDVCRERWTYYNNHKEVNDKAVGLLRNYAKKYVDNEILLRADTTTKYNDIYEIQGVMSKWDTEVYNERYCRELDFSKHDLIVDKSGLGTGKTTVIKNYIKAQNPMRILIIGCRVTFCREKYADFNEFCPDMEYYKDSMEYNSGNPSKINKLVVQYESLHKLGDIDTFNCYDLLVLDEIEALLSNVTSETNGNNLDKNVKILKQLIKTSKKVIMADAFVSKRTLSVVEQTNKKVLVRVNEYKRKGKTANIMCIQRSPRSKNNPKDALIKELVKRVTEGEKVCVVVASRMFGDELKASLTKPLQDLGLIPDEAMKFYERFCDDNKMRDDLKQVREAWSKLHVLIYTTKITVGVNYDDSTYDDDGMLLKDNLTFDATFIYASNALPCVRDLIQGHFRVRHTKEDNIYVYIRDIPDTFVGRGEKSPPKRFDDFKEMSDFYTSRYSKVSGFYDKIQVYNEYETDICYNDYTRVFKYYLLECGYEISDQSRKAIGSIEEVKEVEEVAEVVIVAERQTLAEETEALTLNLPDIKIDEFKAYITNGALRQELDMKIKSESASTKDKKMREGLIMYNKCLKHSAKYHEDIEGLSEAEHEEMFNTLLDEYVQPNVSAIIDNIKFEKQRRTNTEEDYKTADKEVKLRNTQHRIEKYNTVKEMCDMLDLETSYSIKGIEESKMVKFMETLNSKSKQHLESIRKLFKIRVSVKKDKENANALEAKNTVKSILKGWNGNTIESTETSHKVKDEATGKQQRFRTYTYKTSADIQHDIIEYAKDFEKGNEKDRLVDVVGYKFID